ncbi:FAD-dependent oxidoreductase [Candidatus Saccharibacteria bacterium]|nr:FAD-dependent oxidoreductase [Candidatus Saccharibacteria bacterium]
MANKKTKILVLGGGFGGIKTALELADNDLFDVTLLSNESDFRYYPTLYHAATGGRMAASSIPLTEIFKDKNVKVEKGVVKKVDRQAKMLKTSSSKQYPYDKLVVALGVVTNYFGIKGLKEYSYGIKSQAEAKELRDHIHKLLLDEGKPDQNYVVIGGGPTGVELAAALPAYIKHVMNMHKIREKKLHIDLVEAAPRLMPRMPRDYSKAVAKRLRQLGVTLYLNQAVQAETADSLMVSGHSIQSHTVVWTAGVTNHPFFDDNKFTFGEHGKVKVDEYLRAEDDIYVIGDNADTTFSGMAQTALYDAKCVAGNLKREASGHRPKNYRPKKPVYVTPVGQGWAAVLWNKTHIYGWFGWVLRSAADFVGYKDYEPWWPASKHWMAEYQEEETCPVCSR